jgi:hypothetical protein
LDPAVLRSRQRPLQLDVGFHAVVCISSTPTGCDTAIPTGWASSVGRRRTVFAPEPVVTCASAWPRLRHLRCCTTGLGRVSLAARRLVDFRRLATCRPGAPAASSPASATLRTCPSALAALVLPRLVSCMHTCWPTGVASESGVLVGSPVGSTSGASTGFPFWRRLSAFGCGASPCRPRSHCHRFLRLPASASSSGVQHARASVAPTPSTRWTVRRRPFQRPHIISGTHGLISGVPRAAHTHVRSSGGHSRTRTSVGPHAPCAASTVLWSWDQP